VPKPLQPVDVVLLVEGQLNRAVFVEREAVVRQRQVFRTQPKVHPVLGDHLQ
jgi:hypothetical protein